MTKIDKVVENWRDPSFWHSEALPYLRKKTTNAVREGSYSLYSGLVHGKPADVVEEDWDNLIILDACRFDTFADVNWLDGELESRISKGCVTGDFLTRNFPNKYPDTVFVAGNPHASRLIPNRFHAFRPAWRTHWDDDLGTVPPDSMSEAVRETAEEFPNKRLVAHFVQPHQPYIGPETLEKHGIERNNGLRVAREMAETMGEGRSPQTNIMDRYRNGKLSREETLDAYIENLEIALEHVQEFVNNLSGKTVISSDHGEMFDEFAWPVPKRRIGHWSSLRTTELVKVPWFVVPVDKRKEITKGTIESASTGSGEERAEKLRSLGYLQ